MTTLPPSPRPPRQLLPWAAGLGFGLLLAPTFAGAALLSIADITTTSFHWRLEANDGPADEGRVTSDTVVYPRQRVDPRAWRQVGLPRLLGVDTRPDGLAWHVEGWTLMGSGDVWIGLDGHPRSVRLRQSVLYPKGTPSVVERTYTFDGFGRSA